MGVPDTRIFVKEVIHIESQEDLNNRAKAAAFIGTLQAGYTDFHYLRDIWKETTEKDALIGVGMTGIGSGVILQYNLKQAAQAVVKENARVAALIGINKAARTTTIKPSGCLESTTEIKTSKGIMTLDEIFQLNDLDSNSCELGFHEVKEELYVYDQENNLQIGRASCRERV